MAMSFCPRWQCPCDDREGDDSIVLDVGPIETTETTTQHPAGRLEPGSRPDLQFDEACSYAYRPACRIVVGISHPIAAALSEWDSPVDLSCRPHHWEGPGVPSHLFFRHGRPQAAPALKGPG